MVKITIPRGYKRIDKRFKPRSGDAWFQPPLKTIFEAYTAIENGNWSGYLEKGTIFIRPIKN
jgi:hypothetical protein